MPGITGQDGQVGPIGPKVVHCKKAPEGTFVYVGRGSPWGNHWSHKTGTMAQFKTETVEQAIAAYEAWVQTQPELITRAKIELKGKDLGCWCVFKGWEVCHARTWLRLANEP